jgi:hypothetical protein
MGSRYGLFSKTQYKQFKNADRDHQHRQRHGVVIKPMPRRYAHDVFPTLWINLPFKLGTLMSIDEKRARIDQCETGKHNQQNGNPLLFVKEEIPLRRRVRLTSW